MAVARSADDRARRRESERRRRERIAQRRVTDQSGPADVPTRTPSDGGDRRAAAVFCAWCGDAIAPRSRGPIPKWCSVGCRRRAWEQGRAAASGRSAVEVVERRVEVPAPGPPTRRDRAPLLAELARQLEDGRVYERDLNTLGAALGTVLEAYHRRPSVRDRSRTGVLPHLS